METLIHLKKELGSAYLFTAKHSNEELQQILKSNLNKHADEVPYSLEAGCVNIEATIFHDGNRLYTGYDICVRTHDAPMEWSSYASIPDKVNLNSGNMEQEMFNVLDRFVKENNLSYTELNNLKSIDIQSNYYNMEM